MITKIGIYKDVRNKGKPWVCRWYGEYDPATGKQRRYTKSFRLKVEAEAFQAKQSAGFNKGKRRDKPKQVWLEDFCKDWLRSRKADLKPGSLRLYDNTIVRLTNYFGDDCLLSEITPRAAAMFISEQKPLKGEKLSTWTRNRTLRHCRTMFTTATNWELIAKNPFSSVSTPKLPSTRWHYLKPDEYLQLLSSASNLRCKALYALAYTAGLRLGEALSLMWVDVDLENGEVMIENRLASKTLPPFSIKDYERRRIPLPMHTRDILSDLKAYNEITDQTPYVVLDEQHYKTVLAKWKRFRDQKRGWQNRDMCNNRLREFKRHAKNAGIKPNGSLSIQTLRKSCCQNWANTISNPEVVRVLAGHADLKTTMQYYCQADKEQRNKAADGVDKLIMAATD